MVKTYSNKRDGNTALSKNFKVSEFAEPAKYGDAVLIDNQLVQMLQRIRDHFGKPYIITGAYRDAAYNASVGGEVNSYHTKGMAADGYVPGIDPLEIAKYAQSIGVPGIGLYTKRKFVHLDVRPSAYYWTNNGDTNAAEVHVSGFNGQAATQGSKYPIPTVDIKKGANSDSVKWIQTQLNAKAHAELTIDGIFGAATDAAVKAYQKAHGLTVDGIVGAKTTAALM